MRLRPDGKFFAAAEGRFALRAARLEDAHVTDAKLRAIAEAGFNVVAAPSYNGDFLNGLANHGLHFLAVAAAQQGVALVDELAHYPQAVGVCLTGADSRAAETAAKAARATKSGLLVSWLVPSSTAPPYPDAFDFLSIDGGPQPQTEDVAHAHRLTADRPVVLWTDAALDDGLTELALRQGTAGVVVSSWPKTAAVARDLNSRTVADLGVAWPSMSVVVCAYNAASTLEECLSHCDRLAYPGLEVIVVDDGSSDESRAIAAKHDRVRLVAIAHAGLSAARNAGFRAAAGDLVAYLDADAYPSPEWPWYLALAAAGEGVGGGGGPNVPPAGDPEGSEVVSHSPVGPMPQLASDERARHLPGCNMAFWKPLLEATGGFDEALPSAEDVEFEWRLLAAGWALGYHPAALIWHHRRPGLRPYLRQQRNYGGGQVVLERRYPERFPRGRWARQVAGVVRRNREGAKAAEHLPVAYTTLRWDDRPRVDLVHQAAIPIAAVLVVTVPLGLLQPALCVPGAAAAVGALVLFCVDLVNTRPRRDRGADLAFRAKVATHQTLRPLAWRWGKLRARLVRSSLPGAGTPRMVTAPPPPG